MLYNLIYEPNRHNSKEHLKDNVNMHKIIKYKDFIILFGTKIHKTIKARKLLGNEPEHGSPQQFYRADHSY